MEEITNCEKSNVEINEKENAKSEVSLDRLDENAKSEQHDENSDSQKPAPELLEKIKKQVEFYFGDVNMQRDKFLIEQTKLDDGWVPMSVMLNFKLLASLTKDVDTILTALEDSELIEISQDRKKIRRSVKKPLPTYDENFRRAQEIRTIYLKGFPLDITMEELKAHFYSVDSIENIIMRKYKKGKEFFFKGSIFLQFRTLEDAKTFMEQESVKYKDTELIKMWSVDYANSKDKEKEERRLKKSQENTNVKNNKNKNQILAEKKFPKGCILHFTNLEKTFSRDNLKQKLIELESQVAYVDYNAGNEEGWIRLQGEDSASELLKKLDSNVIKVDDVELKCELLGEEEEKTYLSKVQENMASLRQKRGRDRGNRKGFKRRHSPTRDGNAKKAHTDS